MQYYDFDVGDMQEMACRPLLRPYYLLSLETRFKLGGMQAAVCPADKKDFTRHGGFYYCAMCTKLTKGRCGFQPHRTRKDK